MRRTPSLLTLVALLVLAACGDGALVAYDPNAPVADDPSASGLHLEILSPQPLTLAPYAVRPLSVRLSRGSTPVEGAELRFTLEGRGAGARLSALRARSSATGEASVEVVAGGETTAFTVRVEADGAAPAIAQVEVVPSDKAPAALRVQVAYPEQGQSPVSRVVVTVHEGGTSCDVLSTLPLPTAAYSATMNDVADEVYFPELDGDTRVTVIALGYNAVAPIADGCLEDVALPAGEEVDLTVTMATRDLDVTGTYDVSDTFDFSDALPGRFGSLLGTVVEIFDDPDDPARYLVQRIEDLVGYDFGIFEGTAVRALDRLIRDFVPERFLRLFEYIGDAAQVVTRLSFEGTLTIERQPDGSYLARQAWDTVVYRWRAGCDASATDGCDLRRIALRNTWIGPLVNTFPVRVEDGVVTFETHERFIPYARFFHLFVLQVVYPELSPGARDTGDVLHWAVSCPDVALELDASDGVADGVFDLGFARPSTQSLQAFCEDALDFVGTLV
ncbi:MAG: hypothetical protein D6729_03065, partial [Deltaproteobacteria bacterium]